MLMAQPQTLFALAKADNTFVRNEYGLRKQVRLIEGRIARNPTAASTAVFEHLYLCIVAICA